MKKELDVGSTGASREGSEGVEGPSAGVGGEGARKASQRVTLEPGSMAGSAAWPVYGACPPSPSRSRARLPLPLLPAPGQRWAWLPVALVWSP